MPWDRSCAVAVCLRRRCFLDSEAGNCRESVSLLERFGWKMPACVRLFPSHLWLFFRPCCQISQWCAEFCLLARYQHGTVVCTQTNGQRAIELALVGYTIPLETCCTPDTLLRCVGDPPLASFTGCCCPGMNPKAWTLGDH